MSDPCVQDWKLPLILEAAKTRQLKIIPVVWRACVWKAVSALRLLRPVPSDGKAVCSLGRKRREIEICTIIGDIVSRSAARPAESELWSQEPATSTGELLPRQSRPLLARGQLTVMSLFLLLLASVSVSFLLIGRHHGRSSDQPVAPVNSSVNTNNPTINIPNTNTNTNNNSIKQMFKPHIEQKSLNDQTINFNIYQPSTPTIITAPGEPNAKSPPVEQNSRPAAAELSVVQSVQSKGSRHKYLLAGGLGLVTGFLIGFLPVYLVQVLSEPKGSIGKF